MSFGLVGDYVYRGCEVAGTKYSVVMLGDMLLRVWRISDTRGQHNEKLWEHPQPMRMDILNIVQRAK